MDLLYMLVALLLGIGMIIVEMLIPGVGVIGIIGLVAVIFVLYSVYTLKGVVVGRALLVGTIILLVVMAFVVRRALSPNGSLSKRGLILNETSDSYNLELNSDLIGRTGICLTSLRPCGYVLLSDQKFEAVSINGLIEKNTIILVDNIREERLYVCNVKPIMEGDEYAENTGR
jgi:membrane-bound serine protease (ClpP class)